MPVFSTWIAIGWNLGAFVKTGPFLNRHVTFLGLGQSTPLGNTVLGHVLGDVQDGQVLENAHHLGLDAFDCPVYVGAFDVELRLVVPLLIWSAFEEFIPILFVQLLTKGVVHLFPIWGQLPKGVLRVGIVREVVIPWIHRIPCPVSKQLINHDKLLT